MIFVTVGNSTQDFRRLLETVDTLAGQGTLGDRVFMQVGNCPGFTPLHCDAAPFLSPEEFQRKMQEARLVICHAGAGTLLHIFRAGKVPVVMPRRKKYGEHVDDHQVESVRLLTEEGRVVAAYEAEDLPAAIIEATRRSAQPLRPSPTKMIELVAQAIRELSARE